MLAPPRSFSQRATSFIASQCQGIHQMPFSALERHTQRQESHSVKPEFHQRRQPLKRGKLLSEDTLDGTHQSKGKAPRSDVSVAVTTRFFTIVHQQTPDPRSPYGNRFRHGKNRLSYRVLVRFGWSPHESGGGERNRTVDLLLAKQALSQLSYTPMPEDQNAELPFLAFCRLFI